MTYKRIRELREDHDLTQKYMAHYLNVIQRTYSRYERGERIIPPDVLCKIADFYNVSVDYLLERTDTKQPYPPSLLSRKTKDTSRTVPGVFCFLSQIIFSYMKINFLLPTEWYLQQYIRQTD